MLWLCCQNLCLISYSPSRAGSCVCVWIQLGAAMPSAELLQLPVEPKEERLYSGGRLETRRRPRTASRFAPGDSRALTLALEWPGETLRSNWPHPSGPKHKGKSILVSPESKCSMTGGVKNNSWVLGGGFVWLDSHVSSVFVLEDRKFSCVQQCSDWLFTLIYCFSRYSVKPKVEESWVQVRIK